MTLHTRQLGGGRRRINRYIMECKLKNSIGFPVAADELIDTLWNVNKYKIGQEERVSITN